MKTKVKFPFKQSAGYIYYKTGVLCARVFDYNLKAYEVNEMADIIVDAINKRWNEQDFDKLLKSQGFEYPAQYFELTANTYSTSPAKAEQLFTAMPLKTKKVFIGFVVACGHRLPNSAFNFFLNLL